jgi:hypothetical protein
MSDDPGPTPPLLAAAVRCLKTRRDQLSSHSAEVEGLLTELGDDVGTLGAQEGWEPAVAAGMADWASDRGNVFRALRVSPPPPSSHSPTETPVSGRVLGACRPLLTLARAL